MGRDARILDAAGELLLALGYRKVTVDDVARRAGVGKGTVYLHWPTKHELFAAVLVREAVEITRELVDALRADPAEAALSRTMRSTFLRSVHRPLTLALVNGEPDAVGAIIADTEGGRALVTGKAALGPAQLGLLHGHGLLADDPATTPDLGYRLAAAVRGYFLGRPDGLDPDPAVRADALALTVRRAFEPPRDPDPAALAAVAPRFADLYGELITDLTPYLPEEEP